MSFVLILKCLEGTPLRQEKINWGGHKSLPDYWKFKPCPPRSLREISLLQPQDHLISLLLLESFLRLNPRKRASLQHIYLSMYILLTKYYKHGWKKRLVIFSFFLLVVFSWIAFLFSNEITYVKVLAFVSCIGFEEIGEFLTKQNKEINGYVRSLTKVGDPNVHISTPCVLLKLCLMLLTFLLALVESDRAVGRMFSKRFYY